MRYALIGWMVVMLAGCGDAPRVTDDQTTPQRAVESLIHALGQNDEQAVRSILIGQTPEQQAYVEAMLQFMQASRKLTSAAQSRFSKQEANQLSSQSGFGSDMIARFIEPGAKLEQEGDRATLVSATGQMMKFRKEGADWKIIPGGWGQDGAEARVESATRLLSQMAGALSAIASAIDSGKVKEIGQARDLIGRHAFASPPTVPQI